MKTFWIVILILEVAHLGRDVFFDEGIMPILSDLFCIGVAIYWLEHHHNELGK